MPSLLIIDGPTVRRLYRMRDAIEAMRGAFKAYSAGGVAQPLRTMTKTPHGVLATMPASVPPSSDAVPGGYGVKAISVVPSNPDRGLPAHSGLLLVFDPESGAPGAVVDAAAVTAIRTAAASAVATDLLASQDADVVAVLGAGVQARTHIEAMASVRPVRLVRIWNHRPERAQLLAKWTEQALSIEAVHAESIRQATADANIVCTATASSQPLLSSDLLIPGVHINAVGSSFPDRRELATDVLLDAEIFVDSRESALNEAGDILIPVHEGRLAAAAIRAELGEVLLHKHPGRTGPDQRTVFKSLGLAVQDVVSGSFILARARETGSGVPVPMDDAQWFS